MFVQTQRPARIDLAGRATGQIATRSTQLKLWNLRIGLRAQSQCRATSETLAALKNPASVAFVRQANIAHGPQQVNNSTHAPSRPRENEITPNKLSGGSDELLPDTRTSAAAGGINPRVEAVEEIDGAKVRRGESQGRAQCLQRRDAPRATRTGTSAAGTRQRSQADP